MERPHTPAPVMVTPAHIEPYPAPPMVAREPGPLPPNAYPMGEQLMPPQQISGVHTHPGMYTHPGYMYPPMQPPPPATSAIWPLAIAVGALALVLVGLVLVVVMR